MKSKLPLKDRQLALKKLKSETKCSDCGELGHWVGDAECKKSKKTTKFSGIADIGSDHEGADGKEEDCQCIIATLANMSQEENVARIPQEEDDEDATTSGKSKASEDVPCIKDVEEDRASRIESVGKEEESEDDYERVESDDEDEPNNDEKQIDEVYAEDWSMLAKLNVEQELPVENLSCHVCGQRQQ
eukprot:5524842-Karenia_brevis.AAC.1